MDRKTVLQPASCDPRTLPLGAIEAFFLSQIDGHLTVEEIAEVVGLDVASAVTLAKRLVELGAARSPRTAPTRREIPAVRRSLRPARVDPRAEAESMRPPRRESKSRVAVPVSMRPSARAEPKDEPKPEPRRTRRSLKMAPVSDSNPARAAVEEPCELDDATVAMLRTFEAQIDGADHFVVLGIERSAERKAVKSAYYALAAKFHPDRYFKKKLGKMRATIEKIFRRVTDAHDVLTDGARREVYERTLPPVTGPVSKVPVTMPSARPSKGPPSARPSKAPPSVRSSKAPPSARASKAPPSVRASKAPPSVRASKAAIPKVALPPPPPSEQPPKTPPSPSPTTKRSSSPRIVAPKIAVPPPPPSKPVALPPKAISSKPVPPSMPSGPKAPPVRLLSADARRRVELFVQAGDEALRANDVIGAANHYRVALQNSNDPALRAKLEMVEGMAKERRFDVSLPRARTAEREQRWAEAAFEYGRAHAARPTAELAERTAHALRMSEGDLGRAVELAEWAVGRVPRSLEFRLTLAEVCLAARKYDRAASECEAARTLAPNDARIGTLHAAVTKAIRTARGS